MCISSRRNARNQKSRWNSGNVVSQFVVISKDQNVLKVCNCRKNHPFLSILCDPPGLTSSGQNEPKCSTVVDFRVFHTVCCDVALDAEGWNRDFDQPSSVFGAFSFLLGPPIFMFFDHRKMFSWIIFERKCA